MMHAPTTSSKREDFGTVHFNHSNVRRRRVIDMNDKKVPTTTASNQAQKSQFASSSSSSSSFQKQKAIEMNKANNHARQPQVLTYRYNNDTAKLLIPSLLVVFVSHHSPVPLMVTLYSILLLYALDLCAAREGVAFGIWMAFAVIMISFVCEHYKWKYDDAWGSFGLFFHVLTIFSACCWGTMQMEWLSLEALDYAKSVEGLLHTILPLAFAVSVSHFVATGMDSGNPLVVPYVYAIVLYYGIYLFGKLPSSYVPLLQQDLLRRHRDRKRSRNKIQDEESRDCINKSADRVADTQCVYSISQQCGSMLIHCLQITPTILYIWQRKSGIIDQGVTLVQDFCSASNILSMSYLLSWLLQYQQISLWRQQSSTNVLPLIAGMVGYVSFQCRYLVPMSIAISQHFHGKQIQPLWQICLSFNVGVLGMVGTAWVYRKKNKEDESILGKKHDDICAILALLSIFSVGASFPFPYTVVLLLVVSIMSITMFAMTKMFEFMAISVFVNGVGAGMLSYLQFAYTEHEVVIFPRILKISLLGFSMIPLVAGACIIFVYSAASLRLTSHASRQKTNTFNITSILVGVYTGLLFLVEASLYHDKGETSVDVDQYPKSLIFATSALLGLAVVWLKHLGSIGIFTMLTVISVMLSKATAAMIEIQSLDEIQKDHEKFIIDALVCMALCLTIGAPYFAMSSVQVKSHSIRTKLRKQWTSPFNQSNMVVYVNGEARYPFLAVAVYCGILLPCLLAVSVPRILVPFSAQLFGSNCVYNPLLQFSNTMGYSLLLWGVLVLFLLKYHAPDGGFHYWRRFASASFIFGTSLLSFAPTSFLLLTTKTSADPYSSMSSLSSGTEVKGAWGLLSVIASVLLALSCPHRLSSKTNSKIIFSCMFGCGLSYFITSQLAEDLSPRKFAYAIISTSFTAFVQTLSSVEVYTATKFIPRTIKFVRTSTAVSLCVSMSMWALDSTKCGKLKGLELGSLHSIQLSTLALFLFLTALSAKIRKKKEIQLNRLQNTHAFLSWAILISTIYGSFGLASVGVHSRLKMIFGLPSSVFLTVAASLLLCAIDLGDRNARRIPKRRSPKYFDLILPPGVKGSIAICLVGSLTVYLMVAIYAIIMRGMFKTIATSHADFFRDSSDVTARLASRFMTHKDAVAFASKLTACSLWTSSSVFVPIKHLVGLTIGPMNVWISVINSISGKHVVPLPCAKAFKRTIFNALILVTCTGIPSLSAAAFLCMVVSFYETIYARKKRWKSKMLV